MRDHPMVRRMDERLKPFMGDAPEPARILGAAGLLPFVVLSVVSLVWGGWVDTALLTWGAMILSGLGMARFGFAAAGLGEGATWNNMTWGVAPTIFAWLVITFLPNFFAMLALAAGLVVVYIGDRTLSRLGGAPAWWGAYRLPLTAIAAACLLIGAI